MNVLVIMIPLGLGLLAIAVWAFVWAVRHGQLENLEQEGMRILLDDDEQVVRSHAPERKDEQGVRLHAPTRDHEQGVASPDPEPDP